MRYLIILLIISALCTSCSNRNDITTQLLNEKKTTEDSISLTSNYESYYTHRAKEERHKGSDSMVWSKLIDSSTYFYGRNYALKERLKNLEFSIDSISRMK